MDGVQLPQGYSHFEEAVYFLPFSSQKFLVHILHILIITLFYHYLFFKLLDLCFQYFFHTLNNMISFLYVLTCIYYLKLLLIISLRLITSLIPIFVPSSTKLNFFSITSLTIHHSNAFFQFSIFFFF